MALGPTDLSSAKERFAAALTLAPELAEVERIITAAFSSDVRLMREIPGYLLNLGGKRIRPVLALLTGKALGLITPPPRLLDIAAGIELIHMATLLHDDIVDRSPIRRHKPSPLAKYGINATLLSGDFLLTRAFGLCARLDSTIINATEQACIELVEGEALETSLHEETHTLSTSLTIAKRKTASLFRLSAFCAAHVAQVPQEVVSQVCSFGEELGVAFQIIDDILDVTSDEATLGKRAGLDIIERKPSVVNVLWLESGDPQAKRLTTPPPEDQSAENEYVADSLAHLRVGPVIQKAREMAVTRAETARESLITALSKMDSQRSTSDEARSAGQALEAVIDFAIDRAL
jgi:octaprenyl-diphosphate synthase